MICIREVDGKLIGLINEEPISDDCTKENRGDPPYCILIRQIRVHIGENIVMSIVFGNRTYSSNHFRNPPDFSEEVETAEIAFYSEDKGGLSAPFEEEWGDIVKGYVDAKEIVYWLMEARRIMKSKR